jgi:hypothetical protein
VVWRLGDTECFFESARTLEFVKDVRINIRLRRVINPAVLFTVILLYPDSYQNKTCHEYTVVKFFSAHEIYYIRCIHIPEAGHVSAVTMN